MTETPKDTVIDYTPANAEKVVKKSGSSKMLLVIALLLTWVAMAGGFIYMQKNPKLIPVAAPNSDQTQALEQKVATLTSEQNSLKQQMQLQEQLNIRMADMQKMLDGLRQEVLAARENVNQFQHLPELDRRLGLLEEQLTRERAMLQDAHTGPLMLSVLTLRDRVSKALPYEADLAALKEMSTTYPSLEAPLNNLQQQLQEGVSTTTMLLEQLKGLERALIVAAQNPGDGVMERVNQSLKRLVTVRKLGEMPTGTEPDAVLWRAQHQLEQGIIPDAITEIRSLPEVAQTLAADWLTQAERVLAVEASFTELYALIGSFANIPPPHRPAMVLQRRPEPEIIINSDVLDSVQGTPLMPYQISPRSYAR